MDALVLGHSVTTIQSAKHGVQNIAFHSYFCFLHLVTGNPSGISGKSIVNIQIQSLPAQPHGWQRVSSRRITGQVSPPTPPRRETSKNAKLLAFPFPLGSLPLVLLPAKRVKLRPSDRNSINLQNVIGTVKAGSMNKGGTHQK